MNKYSYANACNASVGLMICNKCGKKINEGDFRYWLSKKGDAYISEHKECSLQDPYWNQSEKITQSKIQYEKNLLAACLKFKQEWGIFELDSLINELIED